MSILSVRDNGFNSDMIPSLCKGIKQNGNLISLDLSFNDLSEENCVKELLLSLSFCPLKYLKLEGCRITDLGMAEFCTFLSRTDICH